MAYVASRRACYFRLGGQLLALGSDHLRQIVAVGSVTRVPRVGPELLGLFSVRGAIVPLIDLRPLLGLSAVQTSSPANRVAALVEYEGHQLAFHLDEVFGFFPYKDEGGKVDNAKLQAFSQGAVTHQELKAVLIDVGTVMRTLERQLVAA